MTALLAGLALVLGAVSVHVALKRNQEAAEARAVVWRSVVHMYGELGAAYTHTLWLADVPMARRYEANTDGAQGLLQLGIHPDLVDAYKSGHRRAEEILGGLRSPIAQLRRERSL